jgi:hypothetical protein
MVCHGTNPSAEPAQSFRTHCGRQHGFRAIADDASVFVEIIEVMALAEQDGGQGLKLFRPDCRARGLSQRVQACRVLRTGSVEGRIGEKSKAVQLQKSGRSTDVCDSYPCIRHIEVYQRLLATLCS